MMSPETYELMAQTYEESIRDLILPGTIQTMTRAYNEICAGEEPWTALGNFTNAWYSYAKHIRGDLVSESLVKPAQETEHTRHWGAFCAASVEFLCDRYGISCPSWVHDPYYSLETPWWYTMQADEPSMREYLLKVVPAPFARRNIFCSNRLFQNKYELYEWMREARAKGITDRSEIWAYVRQKETSIHGG